MSTATPAQVDVIIQGTAQGLTTAVAQAQKSLKNLGLGVVATGNNFKAAMGGMATAAGRIVAPIGAAVAAYASFQAVVQSINNAGELDKISKSLDINVEKLQELQFVAGQTGGSADGLSMGLREMGRFLTEVRDGSEEAKKSFASLGLDMNKLRGLSVDQQFYEIADALSKVTDAQKRTSLAQDVFGRSSRDLAETLSTGKSAMEGIAEEGRKAGVVLSAIDVKNLEGLGDALDLVKGKTATGVASALAGISLALSDVLKEVAKFELLAGKPGDTAEKASQAVLLAGHAAVGTLNGAQAAGWSFLGSLSAIGEGATRMLGVFNDVLTKIPKWFEAAAGAAGAAMDWLWGWIQLGAAKAWEGVLKVFVAGLEPIGKHLRELGLLAQQFGIAGGESLTNLGEGAENFAKTFDTSTKKAVESAKAEIASATSSMKGYMAKLVDAKADQRPKFIGDLIGYFSDLKDQGIANIDKLIEGSLGQLGRLEQSLANVGAGGAAPNDDAGKAAADAKKKVQEQLYRDLAMMEKAYYDTSSAVTGNWHEVMNRMALQENTNRVVAAQGNFNELSKAAELFGMSQYEMEQKNLEEKTKAEQLAYAQTQAYYAALQLLGQDHQAVMAENARMHAENQLVFAQNQSQREIQVTAQKAAVISDVMGQAAALMDKNNKSQFMAWKVFASSQALINAFLAYSQVLASPFPDFFGVTRATMANVVLGLGLANAAKIATTPFGGKGGGSGGGSVGVPSMQKQDTSNQGGPGNTSVNVAL